MKIDILKRIDKRLSPNKVDFSAVENEITALKKKLEETVNIQTVDDVSRKLKQFQNKIDLQPILNEVNNLKEVFNTRTKELESYLIEKTNELNNKSNLDKERVIKLEIETLKNEIGKNNETRDKSIGGILSEVEGFKSVEGKVSRVIKNTIEDFEGKINSRPSKEELKKSTDSIQTIIDDLRSELLKKFSNRGGGSPNQQINVNSSVMSSKYADINFVSNTAIKWVATDDATNKRVNIVASLISGGSGGAGNPGGSDTQIQFNDAGSFGGASISYDKNIEKLYLTSVIAVVLDIKGLDGNTGGEVTIEGGSGAVDTGGSLSLLGGDGVTQGGTFGITGGDASAGSGGNIIFTPGDGSTTDGSIHFQDPASGIYGLTWNGNVLDIGQQGSVKGLARFAGATTGTVGVQAASVAGNWTLTLPPTDGSANQVLTTDGNGITVWASVAATGGSGITRNVSIITANTTAGDAGSTDYVYFAEAGMRITLPTAVGNKNLYTVKNHSASSVLVLAPEGIDGSASALMPVNYESLSFISNSSIYGVV